MSRKTAIMELEGLTEEQAEAEIKRIEVEEDTAREREEESKGDGDVFNRLNAMYDNINKRKPSDFNEPQDEEEQEEDEQHVEE